MLGLDSWPWSAKFLTKCIHEHERLGFSIDLRWFHRHTTPFRNGQWTKWQVVELQLERNAQNSIQHWMCLSLHLYVCWCCWHGTVAVAMPPFNVVRELFILSDVTSKQDWIPILHSFYVITDYSMSFEYTDGNEMQRRLFVLGAAKQMRCWK